MVLSFVTYGFVIAIMLWGVKFAGIKGFHEDFMSLKKTKALRGVSAVCVILHHISQQEAFKETKTLSFFENIGLYFVAVFFFCSGYGLVKSLRTKPDYFKGFVKNRIVKTLWIPFIINSCLYCLFYKFIMNSDFPVSKWICGVLGLTLINDYAWFPVVLTVLYIAFFFAYRNEGSEKKGNFIVALVIFFMACLFCIEGHLAWWADSRNWYLSNEGWASSKWWMGVKVFWFSGEWWVNSCIAFLMGILFAQKEKGITAWLKKAYFLKYAAVLFLTAAAFVLSFAGMEKFGYWTEWNGTGPGIGNKFITFFLQEPSVIFAVILIFMTMMKFNSVNPVLRFFGNISLETYLMNYMAILLFWSVIYKAGTREPLIVEGNLNLVKYTVCVFAASVVLGLIYKFICTGVKKLIK